MVDPANPSEIARKDFEVVRRGFDQQAVRGYLHELSSQIERLLRVEAQLTERLNRAEARASSAEAPDESAMLEILGEETTRVLTSARDAAADIRSKAEHGAERILAEASAQAAQTRSGAVAEADKRLAESRTESEKLLTVARGELDKRTQEAEAAADRIRSEANSQAQAARDDAQRLIADAKEEASSIVESAKAEGRELVTDAQAVRERVLRDLSTRRKKARQQIEQLNAGRERLLQAYDVVRSTVDDATNELNASVGDARLAAAAAARRIEAEPQPTIEQLDEELATAKLVDLPIAEPAAYEPPPLVRVPKGRKAREEQEAAAAAAARAAIPAPPPAPAEAETDAPAEPEAPAPPAPRAVSTEAVITAELADDPSTEVPESAYDPIEPPSSAPFRRLTAAPTEIEPEPEAAAAVVPEPTPEPQPEPQVQPEPEPEPEPAAVVPEPEPEAKPEAAVVPEPESGSKPAPSAADALFARLHADVEQSPAAEPGAEEDEAPSEEPVSEEARAFRERDSAVDAIERDLARRLKRALADEQNEVLDRLRRAKPHGVDDLLPSPDEHAARWSGASGSPLADAATAGAAWVGGRTGSAADLADELARGIVLPLRERIDRSFAAADGNLDDVADRVRALYREWKNQKLPEAVPHFVAAAYARGVFEGTPDGGQVQWVVDPDHGPCPDCDDNVLAGAIAKGEDFPTGNRCAPAHPGCRCLVLAVAG